MTSRPDEVPSRITEDDRGIAVKRLQEAFVDGHISHEELDERLQAVLTAKTHGDLGPALASLPDTNVDRVLSWPPRADRSGGAAPGGYPES